VDLLGFLASPFGRIGRTTWLASIIGWLTACWLLSLVILSFLSAVSRSTPGSSYSVLESSINLTFMMPFIVVSSMFDVRGLHGGVLSNIMYLSFGAIFSFIVWWPIIALNTKRLHDTGWSGVWQALPLLAPIGVFGFLFVRGGPPGGSAPESLSMVFLIIAVATLYMPLRLALCGSRHTDNAY
jgi:uncharacterized membrane protein YhaH (DUF805 family)